MENYQGEVRSAGAEVYGTFYRRDGPRIAWGELGRWHVQRPQRRS